MADEVVKSKPKKHRGRWLRRTLFGIAVLLAFLAGATLGVNAFFSRDLPPAAVLESYEPKLGTKVFAANGDLVYEFSEEKRSLVTLDQIPENLKRATIAVEDRKFYSHVGVDPFRIIGAALADIRHGEARQGASTITQQLARNLFLTREQTLSRKIKEILLSLKLEQIYTKDQILELYFNQIYFGHGAYGAEAASLMYFDRHVGDLTLPQAALLAGLPKAPQNYSPYDHPDQALRRRSLVLEAMVKTGAINRRDAEAAKNAPLELAPRAPQANEAPYYVEEVRKHMEERYGSNLLYRGGMTINTTLDLRLQRIANRALEEWLTKLEDQYKFKIRHRDVVISAQAADSLQETNYIQGALVAMDPRSGRVLAMIGGRDFVHSKFNRATQAERQAGSSFKPFIYTAAIDGGFTPASVLVDAPLVVPVSGWRLWKPTNYDHTFGGPTTLRMALALSRNIIAVKLIMEVGPTSAANYAHKMGIKSKIPEVLSLALGSADVNLLEMVDAYSTLANQGTRNDPVLITKVTDRTGKILEEDHPMPERVLSTQTAFTMVDMMRGVVDYGTAARARGMGFTRPAAGKTGTTNDYTDAWFIGFTPDLTCGVWVGFDQKKTIAYGATGSSFALPAWVEFMKAATATTPTSDFTSPGGMITAVICTESGLLATPDCPKVKNEVFISGTEPKTFCDIHKLQNLNVNVKDYNFERLDKQSLESPDFEKPKDEKTGM